MKTINKRVEDLETGVGPKPIMILWGDMDDSNICRVDDVGEALLWDAAIERFVTLMIGVRNDTSGRCFGSGGQSRYGV